MNVWIDESISFLSSLASFLGSTPIIYLTACFIMLIVIRLFKRCLGG